MPQSPQVQNARGAVVGASLRELQQTQVAAELSVERKDGGGAFTSVGRLWSGNAVKRLIRE